MVSPHSLQLKQVGLEDTPPSDLYEEFVLSLRSELLSEQDGSPCATVEGGRQPGKRGRRERVSVVLSLSPTVASIGQEAELWNVDPLLKQFFTGLHISEGDCHK